MNSARQGGAHTGRRRTLALLAALPAALALPALPALGAPAQPPARTHAVDIEGVQFSPATLTVKAGDTVVWHNKDPFAHNVTAQDMAFHSGDIQSGHSWKYKARKKGVFPYVCTLHPGMKAVLVVE